MEAIYINKDSISKMDFKELREEVQYLRDQFAIFKRKYDDAINNINSDNLDKGFKIEQGNMKSQIKATAKALESTVTEEDLQSELSNYSTITQTSGAISQYVSRQADLKNAVTIRDLSQAIDTNKTYKIVGADSSETYYYYNTMSKDWEKISGDTVYTVFDQTSNGFKLKGNTIIDGDVDITENLTVKIAKVANQLALGSPEDSGQKKITFRGTSNIHNIGDGLAISASSFAIDVTPDYIMIASYGGSSISLEDYITQRLNENN